MPRRLAAEQKKFASGHRDGGEDISGVPVQMVCSPGMPERKAVGRRRARVMEMMHTLPQAAQEAITDLMKREDADSAELARAAI